MSFDRRNFLKNSLGGIAGITAVPLVGSLAGCATAPAASTAAAGSASAKPAPARVVSAKALPITKVTDRVSVVTGAPGQCAGARYG